MNQIAPFITDDRGGERLYVSSQRQAFEKALSKVRPEIREAFLRAVRRAKNYVPLSQVVALLDRGDTEGAVQLIRLSSAEMAALREAVRGGFVSGGRISETIAPRGMTGGFSFDGFHARADAWVRQRGATLIQGIQADTLEATRNVIRAGLSEGRSSRAIAADIVGKRVGRAREGGFLGLTTQITDSIISGRAKLASGDPRLMREYLALELRNKQFDGSIKKAIKEGRPITGSQLDRIIRGHQSKALGARGLVIAQHEGRRAIAAGRHEGMQQILDRPDVEAVTKRWQHNLSREPREDHQLMNGTVINFGERFEFGGVSLAHPHEEGAPAEHTINCGCMAMYRVRLRLD